MHAMDCRKTALLLFALFVATNGSAAPDSAKAARQVAHRPEAFAFMPEAECANNRFGFLECAIDGYEVAGDPRECQPDAPTFGSIVSDGGAELLDRFPEAGARYVAKLANRQFVCIATEVSIRGVPTWSYVIALPTRAVPDCRGMELCRDADLPIGWADAPPATRCRLEVDGRYSSGCAAGWVPSEQVESYSMGIRPIGD